MPEKDPYLKDCFNENNNDGEENKEAEVEMEMNDE